MELVYLWVENYKNIYRQGFNFSPRFRCSYNYDKNELIIKENDDYIENFFSENDRYYSYCREKWEWEEQCVDNALKNSDNFFNNLFPPQTLYIMPFL